ncbi:glycine-rich RNA-binding protein 3, mitochondrial isoform X2 [Arachis ipaensis]|uniref:glycine-rich RNA-binding protein 3, mitochondrial isoform X2 n=1 Tax=Arachis ipaensis TaxID=130454 RepID=UPI000A2B8746|nr:glycine-rich RNA-binding protein 3, mitochondrial isoform X2 [Arachis ipaensis]
MAFLSRAGNILRQVTSRKISSDLCEIPSVFRSVRCMSNAPSTKLFIGGVSYSTDEQSLREVFGKYGDVVDARIIVDRDSGRSRGFGFITYSSVEEASSAIQALDGQDLHGRRVKVNFASERPRGFQGGGFGGSFDNAPYGNSPYGASLGGGGSYGGAYGANVAGGYGNGSSGYGGDSYGSSGNTYNSESSGGYGGGNDIGTYGNAAASGGGYGGYVPASGFDRSNNYNTSAGFPNSDNYANAAGGGGNSFPSSQYNGSAMAGYGSGGVGSGSSFASGYGATGHGSTNECNNDQGTTVDDFGGSMESNFKGNYEESGAYAKRA